MVATGGNSEMEIDMEMTYLRWPDDLHWAVIKKEAAESGTNEYRRGTYPEEGKSFVLLNSRL